MARCRSPFRITATRSALILACALFGTGAHAQTSTASIGFSNLQFTVIDLTPDDGLLPSVQWLSTSTTFGQGTWDLDLEALSATASLHQSMVSMGVPLASKRDDTMEALVVGAGTGLIISGALHETFDDAGLPVSADNWATAYLSSGPSADDHWPLEPLPEMASGLSWANTGTAPVDRTTAFAISLANSSDTSTLGSLDFLLQAGVRVTPGVVVIPTPIVVVPPPPVVIAIPEPTTWAQMALGLISVGALATRRARRQVTSAPA